MRRETRTRIVAVSALLATVMLGTLGSSGIARAAQSVQAAPSITSANCTQSFFLDNRFNGGLNSYGIIRSGNLDFNAQNGGETKFCQAPISSGSKTVLIYESGTNDCLALNASLNTVYLHAASGCDGSLAYTQWQFIALPAVATPHVYALQLQYDYAGLGVNKPCLYAGTAPASLASCSAENSDEFLQFIYKLT